MMMSAQQSRQESLDATATAEGWTPKRIAGVYG
jgi:hypothetical protein